MHSITTDRDGMTTNQTIELIHRHTSVRSYKPDPLPATLVEKIVAAGQRSSTSSNLQMYSAVALLTYDAAMVATGIYQGRQVDTTGRFDQIPTQMYGWTEHSARRVASPRRPDLRDALVAQGFELR